MKKPIKWVKTSLYHKIIVFPRNKSLLSRKRIKREMYMLIIWGYFGTKLFWVLGQENCLTGYISSGFYCIQWHINCAGSIQIPNTILMVNVTRCQWKHLWLYLKQCPRICPQNIRKTPGTKIVTPPKYNELCCDIHLRDSEDCTGHYHAISETGIFLSFILFFF